MSLGIVYARIRHGTLEGVKKATARGVISRYRRFMGGEGRTPVTAQPPSDTANQAAPAMDIDDMLAGRSMGALDVVWVNLP